MLAGTNTPRWMATTLWLAADYNFLWAVAVILFPREAFRWAALEPPRYPLLLHASE